MTTITYDGLALVNPEPLDEVDEGIQAREIRLYSGKTYVKTSAETRFKGRFRGFTPNKSDVTALLAKKNKKASLVVDSDTYTNCAITGFRWGWRTAAGTYYWYEVEFTQDTT